MGHVLSPYDHGDEGYIALWVCFHLKWRFLPHGCHTGRDHNIQLLFLEKGKTPGTHRKERLPPEPSLNSSTTWNLKRSCLDMNSVHPVPAELTSLIKPFRSTSIFWNIRPCSMLKVTASVVCWSEFLAIDKEVPDSIPGLTRFSDK
jgi:hypothetical protein